MKKYFIKYIIEFFVIFLGISVSFWINEWNTNRINNFKQLYYLEALKSDLEKQMSAFKYITQHSKSTIENAESILEYYSSTGNLWSIDSINLKLSRLMYTRTYPDITTTFNELKSTGDFDLIKEKSLCSSIIKYYQNSNSYQQRHRSNIDVVYYAEIFPIIKSSIIIQPSNFGYKNEKIMLNDNLEAQFKNQLNDQKKVFDIVNAVSLRIVVSMTNQNYIEIMKNEAALLLSDIKNEIILLKD